MVPEDDWLIDKARRGDVSAFNQLVERMQGLVYNVCFRVLADADLAADATQETFFAAYRSLNRYRGGSFRAWLLRIATNECYDTLRKRRREAVESLPESFELEERDPAPALDDRAISSETIRVLERAIASLPPEQRMCVVLIDVQGLGYDEAAAALNVNLGTVKSRLSRARSALRELIPPEYRLKGGE